MLPSVFLLTCMNKKVFIPLGIAVMIIILVVIWVMSRIGITQEYTSMGTDTYFGAQKTMDYDESGSVGLAAPAAMPSRNAFPEESSASGETTVGEDRLIIKTGNLSLVVDNVQAEVARIAAFAADKGGFVVSSNIYKGGYEYIPYERRGEVQEEALMADITIRIPVEVFDAGVEEIKTMGDVVREQVNGQDVTEEFVDLDAEVRNLRKTEQQFLEIMERATKIEDVLAVQRELTVIRGQIDRIQGRMNYLQKSAQLSTLTVHLATDPEALPVVDEDSSWKPLGTIKAAVRSLIDFGIWVANVVIWAIIFIPLWLVLWLLVRFGKSWWREHQTK